MADAQLFKIDQPVSVLPQAGAAKELIASSTLSQALQDTLSDVVSVADARRVALWVTYTPHASATAGYPHIVVAISSELTEPAIGDDSWFPASALDTSYTDADITATVPTGADYTTGPEWREIKAGPIVLRTFAADGTASEDVRVCFVIDVAHARWMYVAAAEKGDATNDGTIQIDWSVSL